MNLILRESGNDRLYSDDHVAWRSPADSQTPVDIDQVLNIVTGRVKGTSVLREARKTYGLEEVRAKAFTGTTGIEDRDQVKLQAEFQK